MLWGILARASVAQRSPQPTTNTAKSHLYRVVELPQLKHHLEGFLQGSRGAFLEAGIHEGCVGLDAGLHMHAPEQAASRRQVPGPSTRCQQAGVALRCGLQPSSLQLPEHLESCLMVCHLQSTAYF